MATGRLGASDLSPAADTSVYTVPADTFSVVSVNIVNRLQPNDSPNNCKSPLVFFDLLCAIFAV